jgi:hypothetical protein
MSTSGGASRHRSESEKNSSRRPRPAALLERWRERSIGVLESLRKLLQGIVIGVYGKLRAAISGRPNGGLQLGMGFSLAMIRPSAGTASSRQSPMTFNKYVERYPHLRRKQGQR